MRIRVGETYSTPQGQPVRIMYETDIFSKGHDMFRPFVGDNGQRYTEDGETKMCFADPSETLQEYRAPTPQTTGQVIGNVVGQLLDRALFNR